jgi:uncharacterized RDD family membrane protein YckC
MTVVVSTGPLRRFGAFVIDQVAMLVSFNLLDRLTGGSLTEIVTMVGTDGAVVDVDTLTTTGLWVVLAISWGYFAGLESSPLQGTAGKLMMGCMVIDTSGQRVSFARATGRWLGKIPSGLLLCIGYIMIIFQREHRGLHDFIAGTRVVQGQA